MPGNVADVILGRHFFQWFLGSSLQAAVWNEARKAEVWGQNGWQRGRVKVLGDGQQAPFPPANGSGGALLARPAGSWAKLRKYFGISGLEKSSNLDILQLVGRFQLSELCKKFRFRSRWGPQTPPAPPKWRPWCDLWFTRQTTDDVSHKPVSGLSLLSARPAVTFSVLEHHRPRVIISVWNLWNYYLVAFFVAKLASLLKHISYVSVYLRCRNFFATISGYWSV